MNKSILLSIKPEWVAKILNGEKTIEVRKQFPKDYKGWVYIYCTKGKPYLNHYGYGDDSFQLDVPYNYNPNDIDYMCNGKVVARFWCDKVEEIEYMGSCYSVGDLVNTNKVARMSCLDFRDLKNYLGTKNGYAIHISKLEIFDKPKELKEFKKRNELEFWQWNSGMPLYEPLTKAPQNYCYVEGDE